MSLKREDLVAFYDDAKSFLNQAEDVVSRALPSRISLRRRRKLEVRIGG